MEFNLLLSLITVFASFYKCQIQQNFEIQNYKQNFRITNFGGKKSIEYKGIIIPALLIVDSAFRLSESMMNPYPFRENANTIDGKFNYTLSKCTKVVEKLFFPSKRQSSFCTHVFKAILTVS